MRSFQLTFELIAIVFSSLSFCICVAHSLQVTLVHIQHQAHQHRQPAHRLHQVSAMLSLYHRTIHISANLTWTGKLMATFKNLSQQEMEAERESERKRKR